MGWKQFEQAKFEVVDLMIPRTHVHARTHARTHVLVAVLVEFGFPNPQSFVATTRGDDGATRMPTDTLHLSNSNIPFDL